MITSVRLAQARPVSYLLAKVLPYHTIEDEQSVTGGQSGATYMRMQTFYMQSAINEAKAVAAKAAGAKVDKKNTWAFMSWRCKSSRNLTAG